MLAEGVVIVVCAERLGFESECCLSLLLVMVNSMRLSRHWDLADAGTTDAGADIKSRGRMRDEYIASVCDY